MSKSILINSIHHAIQLFEYDGPIEFFDTIKSKRVLTDYEKDNLSRFILDLLTSIGRSKYEESVEIKETYDKLLCCLLEVVH